MGGTLQAQDGQEAAGRHIRSEGGGRWWQRCAGGGTRGLGGMDRTSGGGHRVEGKCQGTMEGNGAGNNIRRGWVKDMERDKVYDRG